MFYLSVTLVESNVNVNALFLKKMVNGRVINYTRHRPSFNEHEKRQTNLFCRTLIKWIDDCKMLFKVTDIQFSSLFVTFNLLNYKRVTQINLSTTIQRAIKTTKASYKERLMFLRYNKKVSVVRFRLKTAVLKERYRNKLFASWLFIKKSSYP